MENKLNNNFKIPKEQILVLGSDYSNSINYFSRLIEKYLETFQNNLKIYTEEYEKELSEINSLGKKLLKRYIPNEKVSIKSPMTVFSAPWGSGKTYFLEKYILNFYKTKKQESLIKDVIYINVSKYAISDNIQNKLILEILKEITFRSKSLGEKIWYIFKSIGLDVLKGLSKQEISLFGFAHLSLDGLSLDGLFSNFKETKKSIKAVKNDTSEDILKELPATWDNTLIIFDNIERIQPHSWDVIRVIIKLQEIENLCLLLPLNLITFQKRDIHLNQKEYQIEKYINLNYFELQQNYYPLLKNTIGKNDNFDEYDIMLFNLILSAPIINESNLSIRQAEKFIYEYLKTINKEEKNFKEKVIPKWIKQRYFVEKVWGNKNILENIIISKLKEGKIYESMCKITDWKNRLYSEMNLLYIEIDSFLRTNTQNLEIYKDEILKLNEYLSISSNHSSILMEYIYPRDFETKWDKINKNYSMVLEEIEKIIDKIKTNLKNKEEKVSFIDKVTSGTEIELEDLEKYAFKIRKDKEILRNFESFNEGGTFIRDLMKNTQEWTEESKKEILELCNGYGINMHLNSFLYEYKNATKSVKLEEFKEKFYSEIAKKILF